MSNILESGIVTEGVFVEELFVMTPEPVVEPVNEKKLVQAARLVMITEIEDRTGKLLTVRWDKISTQDLERLYGEIV